MKSKKFGMRTRRGTKKTKLKWRNIVPALLIGGVVSFAVWQIAAYCCALLQMTMPVLVWALFDSVIFVLVSMVAVMHINSLAATKAVTQKIDWDKVQKFQKLSEICKVGIPLAKLQLDGERMQKLEQMQIYTVQALYGRIWNVTEGGALGFSGEELKLLQVKVREVLGPDELAKLDKLAVADFPICCDDDEKPFERRSSDPRSLRLNGFFNRYW